MGYMNKLSKKKGATEKLLKWQSEFIRRMNLWPTKQVFELLYYEYGADSYNNRDQFKAAALQDLFYERMGWDDG